MLAAMWGSAYPAGPLISAPESIAIGLMRHFNHDQTGELSALQLVWLKNVSLLKGPVHRI